VFIRHPGGILPSAIFLFAAVHAIALAADDDGTSLEASVHARCDAHTQSLFDAIDQADYAGATALFDAPLRERYTAEKLKQDVEAMPATYGKMLGRGRPHTGDMNGHTVVMAPLIFERGTVTAEIHCASDGTVSDFRLAPTQVMSKP
jgi:hypothetical protein